MNFAYRTGRTVCIYLYVHVWVLYIISLYHSQFTVLLVIVQTCLLNSKDDVYEHAADIVRMVLQTSLAQYGWREHDFEGKH